MSAEDVAAVWCCSNCGAVYHKDYPRCPFDGGEVVLSLSDPLLGQRIANYLIDRLIGEGGMGRVYAAHHANLASKRYAVKVLLGDVAATSSMRERFTREAEAASRLEHPNVVNVLDYGAMESGLPYIVMDFVDGVRLTTLLDCRMEPSRVIRIARAVAEGLAYAHAAGVVHRDLKPDNVMIVIANDGSEVPRIADFGLATSVEPESARLTSTGMAMGTPAYAAPEQMAGRRVDHRADLYSLGMTMFEMLTGGTLPFEGHPMETAAAKAHREAPRLSELAPGIQLPPGLEDLVMSLIRRSAAERPGTARAVIDALDKIVLASVVDERAATVAESSGQFATVPIDGRPRRRIPFGVVLAALGGLAGATAWWLQRPDDSAQVASAAPAKPPAPPPKVDPPAPPPVAAPPTVDPPATDPPEIAMDPPAHDPPVDARHGNPHHDTHKPPQRPTGVRQPPAHVDPPKHVDVTVKHDDPPKHDDPKHVDPPHDGLMPPRSPDNPGSAAPPPPPPPPVTILTRIAGVAVHGPLSQQTVERAVDRVVPAVRQCAPAQPGNVAVHFTIDESRRPQHVHASPANPCIVAALGGVRTESAPDVGDAEVDVQISFVAR